MRNQQITMHEFESAVALGPDDHVLSEWLDDYPDHMMGLSGLIQLSIQISGGSTGRSQKASLHRRWSWLGFYSIANDLSAKLSFTNLAIDSIDSSRAFHLEFTIFRFFSFFFLFSLFSDHWSIKYRCIQMKSTEFSNFSFFRATASFAIANKTQYRNWQNCSSISVSFEFVKSFCQSNYYSKQPQ